MINAWIIMYQIGHSIMYDYMAIHPSSVQVMVSFKNDYSTVVQSNYNNADVFKEYNV